MLHFATIDLQLLLRSSSSRPDELQKFADDTTLIGLIQDVDESSQGTFIYIALLTIQIVKATAQYQNRKIILLKAFNY